MSQDRPAHCPLPTAHFSLYLHIPYCVAKCPYCDFNSHAASRWPERDYTDALIAELEHYAGDAPWRGAQVATIFFGGGTPSLFAPESIGSILNAVHRLWPTAHCPLPTADYQLPTAHCETTLEANPGTITEEKLAGFRAAGINRLSFGVQSFHPRHLQTLGRIHNGHDAIDAVRAARAAGFDNVNIDLIFAVPGQSLEEWDADLRTAVELGTEHVSAYNLTFEEGTAFHAMRKKGEIVAQLEEIELAMFTRTQEALGAAGLVQYEISNYSRANRACQHNLNYWRSGAYLGVGAGAHSFAWQSGGRRWSNEKSPTGYITRIRQAAHARVTEETLSEQQARGELVFLGLRCLDGLDTRAFADRFGVDLAAAFPHCEHLQRQGLLIADDHRLRLSDRGLLVADTIFATFL
jgi:oxygen-independent coproporphyrinogen-3 oxidase